MKSPKMRPRTAEEFKVIYANRPKCINHPTSLPTQQSVKAGTPLCFRCDPEWKRKKDLETAQMYKGKGKRRLTVPSSIVDYYESAVTDEHLVELREDIAVAEARLQQILSAIKESPYEANGFISFFKKTFEKQLHQVKRGFLSYPEFTSNMLAMLQGKVAESLQYAEFYKVTDIKRKLVEAETKRIAQLGWTPDYVYALVIAMTNILKDLVPASKVVEFHQRLADDQVFQNKQFQLIPQTDLTQKTMNEYITAEEVDGIYEVEYESRETIGTDSDRGGEGIGRSDPSEDLGGDETPQESGLHPDR